MKILVTGGCGFIGSNLVPLLLLAGHHVRVLDNFHVGTPKTLAGLAVDLREGDIRDPATVAEAVAGIDVVIHLAAQTGVVPSQQAPRQDFEINARGTFNLLLASCDAEIRRFIFASSNAPLGEVSQLPFDETCVARPLSPYGASKLAGEGYCTAFYGSYDLPTVVLRFANVYGPRSNHKESVVARFIRDLLGGYPLTIYGNGDQTRDLIYVGDLCAAIIRVLDAEQAVGQVLQIATGIETKIRDLAILVSTSLGRPEAELRFLPARQGEVPRSYAAIDRTTQLLQWEPTVTLETGVLQTCCWFLEHQL